jgi:RNA polymerase sigma factor (sigma-70 family)
MTEGTGAMKNTLFENPLWKHLSREQQMRRIKEVIREELTELQRYTLVAYYFEDRSILQIAEERSVNKSTVLRTLRRAETKLQRYLKY